MIKYGTNNIGKIYFGSNLIGKVYFGSNLVYGSGQGPGPGPQPTGTAYIRGGADGSYIDTGITADNTTRVVLWARNLNPSPTDWLHVFGSRNASSNNSFMFAVPNANRTGLLATEYGNASAVYSSDAFEYLSGYHKYELYDGDILVDDTVVASSTKTTFSNSHNIFLFSVNTNGTSEPCPLPIDIHACKIYKAGVLVRDFTAVNSPSIGLYDAVSNTLFTNSGSGAFTYGAFNENAYTPLQYIECNAMQAFDSGAKVSYSDSIVCKFMPTETQARFYFLCSAPPSGSTGLRAYIGNATSLNYRFYLEEGSATAKQLYNSTNPRLSNLDIIFTLQRNTGTLYRNNARIGTQVTTDATASFETAASLIIGSSDTTYDVANNFKGRIYYFQIGAKRTLVPAKVNNIAGMYDTYNDVFYPSVTGTHFNAGPEL